MRGAAEFAGNWTVARLIDDHLSGHEGRFDGHATFTPQGPDRLHYQEQGRLQFGNGPAMEATRTYLWRFDAAGVAVLFDDGRPFHRFTSAGRGEGTDHPCGADLYRVAYDFTRWPDWHAVWTVTGPRKDYAMESRFSRP